MRVKYHKLKQVVTSNTAVILDVISLFEKINTSPASWYATIDLTNAFFFSIPVSKGHQKQFLSAGKTSNIPSLSYHRGI